MDSGFDVNIWQPLAGLALFLLAMSLIEEAVRLLAGQHFKSFLANHTNTPVEGILSGTVATALLQSSSFVGLLMLAFVGARLLPLQNALAVVLGANMGTTATGWVVATLGFKLNIATLALPLIGIGGPIYAIGGNKRIAKVGQLVLALGLLLLGLDYMKTAIDDVSTSLDLDILRSLTPIQYLLFGVIFSAVVQSSSATILVTLSALDAGIITLPTAAAIAIGADLGTTSTVLFGSIGGSANSKRLAIGHLFFNIATNTVAFTLRAPILYLLSWIADPTLTLVAFHSAFNLLGIILFYPMLGRFTAFLNSRFVADDRFQTTYIEPSVPALPETVAPAVELEVVSLLHRIIEQNQLLFLAEDTQNLDEHYLFSEASDDKFSRLYDISKQLEGDILNYVVPVNRGDLSKESAAKLDAAINSARAGIMSSKACQDLIDDLAELQRVTPELHQKVCCWQLHFYQRLASILEREVADPKAKTALLADEIKQQNREIHRILVSQLQAESLSEQVISSTLNLNQLLLQSNEALHSGVSGIFVGADEMGMNL